MLKCFRIITRDSMKSVEAKSWHDFIIFRSLMALMSNGVIMPEDDLEGSNQPLSKLLGRQSSAIGGGIGEEEGEEGWCATPLHRTDQMDDDWLYASTLPNMSVEVRPRIRLTTCLRTRGADPRRRSFRCRPEEEPEMRIRAKSVHLFSTDMDELAHTGRTKLC
ncbi:hypothetical protein B296_00007104 [Ensete ventricosum]|uniref:Uncharacterized protein n=1 Tax=Ensete ventricosum TaxID=4639 RepID=A0A427AR18_ENSVE|nr:hypothetical protein B296_00007104 [Ensete ventricosum]